MKYPFIILTREQGDRDEHQGNAPQPYQPINQHKAANSRFIVPLCVVVPMFPASTHTSYCCEG